MTMTKTDWLSDRDSLVIKLREGTFDEYFNALNSHELHNGNFDPTTIAMSRDRLYVKGDTIILSNDQSSETCTVYEILGNDIGFLVNLISEDMKTSPSCKIPSVIIDKKHSVELIDRLEHLKIPFIGGVIQKIILHDLEGFDPELKGSQYRMLRNDVSKARRDGLQFKRVTNEDIVDVFTAWSYHMHKKEESRGIEFDTLFELARNPTAPGLLTYCVTDKNGFILAATGIGYGGKSANIYYGFTRPNTSRATPFLDYMVMCELKKTGFLHLHNGPHMKGQKGESMLKYKKRFQPMKLTDVHTYHFGIRTRYPNS